MKIKKSGFLYQLAFCLDNELTLPNQVSLCELCWRSCLVPPACVILILTVFCGAIFLFPFGLYPGPLRFKNPSAKTEKLPLPKIGGKRILPIVPIGILAIIYFNIWTKSIQLLIVLGITLIAGIVGHRYWKTGRFCPLITCED